MSTPTGRAPRRASHAHTVRGAAAELDPVEAVDVGRARAPRTPGSPRCPRSARPPPSARRAAADVVGRLLRPVALVATRVWREVAHPPRIPAPRPLGRPTSWVAAQAATSRARAPMRRLAQRPADGRPHAARRRVAARQAHADARPVDPRRRSRPCRRPPGTPRPGSRGSSARIERPVAAVADDHVAGRHRLRVRQPRHQHGVARDVDRRVGLAPVPGRDHAHRLVREAARAPPAGACARDPARSRAPRARPGPRPAAGRRARRAAPTSAGRPPSPTPATRAGTRAGGGWRPACTRARARCAPTARGGSPSRRRDSLNWSRPCSSAGVTKCSVARAHSRAPTRVRGSRAPIE